MDKTTHLIKNYISNKVDRENFSRSLMQIKKQIKHPIDLDLSELEINDSEFELLSELPIKSLNIEACPKLTNGCMKLIGSSSHLKVLLLGINNWVDDKTLESIPNHVTTLSLGHCPSITGKGLRELSNSAVVNLSLFDCDQLSDIDLENLPKQLKQLDLRNLCEIGEKTFRTISEMNQLHSLILGTSKFNPKYLMKLPVGLIKLNLTHCFKENGYLSYIQHLKQLSALSISSNPIEDNDLIDIPSSVQSLNLAHCSEITDEGLKLLSTKENLSLINLNRCPHVTQSGVDMFDNSVKIIWNCPSPTRLAIALTYKD